jgi:CHAT domain-containing protein/tetratricopeptide (TPR) repeat protein
MIITSFVKAQVPYDQLKAVYNLLRKEQKQDSALVVAKQMTIWALKNETDTSLRYAVSLRYIGNCFVSLNKTDSAIHYYESSIRNLEKEKRRVHPEYVFGMNNLANLFYDLGEYNSAKIYYKKISEIYKKTIGEQHLNYASNLNKLAILCYETGDYKIAESYFKQVLEIRKKASGEQSSTYAASLMNIANLYFKIGDYKTAEGYYRQALEIRKKAFGEQHPEYAISLYNLANLYFEIGDYKPAEYYYKQALDIFKKKIDKQHLNYASNLNSLGAFYKEMGDYKTAENYLRQALEIRKKAFGEQHPDYASTLNNIANIYFAIGDYKSAESYYIQISEIYKKRKQEEQNPDYVANLSNFGAIYSRMGDYKTAENYFKQALEINKKLFGEQHPDYSSSLNNIAKLYLEVGDYKIAENYLRRALEIRKKAFGEQHPEYMKTMNSLATLYMKINQKNQAHEIFAKIFSVKSIQITNNFNWLNENQQEAYWKKENVFYDNLSWYANQSYQDFPEAAGLNYNAILFTKSKILERRVSREDYFSEIDLLREELAARRKLLAKMESEGFKDKNNFDKLQYEADSLDKRLTLSWTEYSQQKKNLNINWQQVQQNLDQNEAAIEFVRFKNEEDSKYYFNALVIKQGDAYPQLVKLCKETDLQSVTVNMGYGAYYPLIWQPLENALNGVKVIYYSPSGILNNLPFNSIIVPKENRDKTSTTKKFHFDSIIQNGSVINEQNVEYLIDKYTLHQLTSTRYLAMGLKQKEKEKIEPNIALVGGVNYDYLPGFSSTIDKINEEKKSERFRQVNSNKLDYLEFSKVEVDSIGANVSSQNWQTIFLEFNDATEENITKLEGNDAKAILHLATHGYVFHEYNFNDTIRENSLHYSYRYSTNSMVRSGLILAGGNWAWAGTDTLIQLGAKQNGILTALEVSQLNLRKTKLVVLSACETGLGNIEGSEGTFGLKRGFKLAGVDQIIVSLWDVPDEETMNLMTLFYNDLTKTLNPVSSFEKAQKEMRNKYPNDPKKWSGFVLVR